MKRKSILTVCLSVVLGLSGLFVTGNDSYAKGTGPVVDVLEESEYSWRYQDGQWLHEEFLKARTALHPDAYAFVDGYYRNSKGKPIRDAVLKGIDVSKHQGKIDWEAVRAEGIDFVIIRCGYGSDMIEQDDAYWEYNVSECERLGIPYGVYLYSYAQNTQMASNEAAHVLRLLEGHTPSCPVYYDLEDTDKNTGRPKVDNETLGAIAQTFCDAIKAKGYEVGIYANTSWWSYYLTDEAFENPDWSKWVAQYNTECTYEGTYDMWQCTSVGSINGISGYVDINFVMDQTSDTNLLRISGKTRYDTAYKAAEALRNELRIEQFDAVILTTGSNFADALSGSYLASEKKAPILLINNDETQLPASTNEVVSYVTKALKEDGTVYILGGTGAVPESVEEALSGYTIKRLSGKNRYETNLEILKEAEVTGEEDLLICTGKSFADSLSASATNRPILLVGDEITKEQAAFLNTISGDKYILGGEAAVNKQIEKAVGECIRISGKSRYETSLLIADVFFPNADTTVIAYAWDFPDGLCGGPLAFCVDGPLILSANQGMEVTKTYIEEHKITRGLVMGGAGVLSDGSVSEIFRQDTGTVDAWRFHTIKYVLNGGVNEDENPKQYCPGTSVVLRKPTKEGYAFAGWYLDETFETKMEYIPADCIGDLILYAKWK